MKPYIVVSGVNLVEMGPLSVFHDALTSLASELAGKCHIVALVHQRKMLLIPGIRFLEFPSIKKSWLRRLWFEFRICSQISRRLKPQFWLSMDNVTPVVTADRKAVYCHNPSPFYRFRLRDLLLDWKFGLFTLFFRYLYGINIQTNDFVIVQQQWIRRNFERRYKLEKVVVAHPTVSNSLPPGTANQAARSSKFSFFFPAYPRPFKNVEILIAAARILEEKGFYEFELWLTFDPTVNRYASLMAHEASGLRSVRWLGLLPRQQVFERYAAADCLVFPSKLETWGLPLTEFKMTEKPILGANLPYAFETIGSYSKAAFFDPEDPAELAVLMMSAATGKPVFRPIVGPTVAAPYARNWPELWSILLPDVLDGSLHHSSPAPREVQLPLLDSLRSLQ